MIRFSSFRLLALFTTGLVILGAGIFFYTQRFVYAGVSHNVNGYAWSDMPNGSDEKQHPSGSVGRGAGWISLNSNGLRSDGTPSGYSSAIDYGVNIDPDTGAFSGYGWSEHMGWINFNPGGSYPGGPAHGAQVDLTNGVVTGWARAISPTNPGSGNDAGGWDGWISMSGSNYEVRVNPQTGVFTGMAWGDWVLGWIDFQYATADLEITEGDPQVSLFATPSCVKPGESTNLSWNSSNTDPSLPNPCQTLGGNWLAPGLRPQSSSGEDSGPLTQTTIFSMQCFGEDGKKAVSTFEVAVNANACISSTVSASKSCTVDSEGVKRWNLRWSTFNMAGATCSVTPNNVSCPDDEQGSCEIAQSGTYTVTCNVNGETEQSAPIAINPTASCVIGPGGYGVPIIEYREQ